MVEGREAKGGFARGLMSYLWLSRKAVWLEISRENGCSAWRDREGGSRLEGRERTGVLLGGIARGGRERTGALLTNRERGVMDSRIVLYFSFFLFVARGLVGDDLDFRVGGVSIDDSAPE